MTYLTKEEKQNIKFIMSECEQRSINDLDIKGCEECCKLDLCESILKKLM